MSPQFVISHVNIDPVIFLYTPFIHLIHLTSSSLWNFLSVDQGPILLAICRSLVASLHRLELAQLRVVLSNRVLNTRPASPLACLDVGSCRLSDRYRCSLLCS